MRKAPTTMQRAYSIFTIKSVDEEKRIIEGIASTPTPDRDGDIVEPMGAVFDVPMPLLWQHRSGEPVGHVIKAKPNKEGIPVTVQIMKTDEPGIVKDRLDMAWQSVKLRLVGAFSIGFIPIESARIKDTFSFRFLSWDWLELSLVTIPANVEATITSIKSLDHDVLLAARGPSQDRVVRLEKTPGVSGTRSPTSKGTGMKRTTQQQLEAFEAKRAASAARMTELMEKAADEGTTLDAEAKQEYLDLQAEVKGIDEHLVLLKEHIKQMRDTAAEVPAAKGADSGLVAAAAAARSGIRVTSNVPKGTAFTRYAIAMARSKGNVMHAAEIAKEWHDSTPEVELALKAAMNPGTTTDATWAAPLAPMTTMSSEFIELLRPATIIGRIPGFRKVPFNISMPRQTAGSSAGWVGQGAPKPVSQLAFDTVTLGLSKIAGIVVLTEELVRVSNPAAEGVVRQDLIDTISQFSDRQFLDPTVAAVANVSPASVTNGVTPRASTGRTVAAITADVAAVMGSMMTANGVDIGSAVWVMNPRTALFLSMVRTSQDVFAFPGLTMAGGTFFGLPVIVSGNTAIAALTGDDTIIVLLNAADIMLADDGAVTLDVSREASLQMSSTPVNSAQAMVSLWQNNLVGLKAERFINYLKRRSTAVQYISDVQY